METELTDQEIRTIFCAIASGYNNHGSFLVYFANAVIKADGYNFALLKPVALTLITKYGLKDYGKYYE